MSNIHYILVIIGLISLYSRLASRLTAVANEFVALKAATHARRNADPIALAAIVLALGQAAGSIHIVAIALPAVALVARLAEAVLAGAFMGIEENDQPNT